LNTEPKTPIITYTVFVDDNFHYMDESERYKLGDFSTCEAAIAACKAIVDEYLASAYEPGMNSSELLYCYHTFGEDPFIISGPNCSFSAWDYAQQRCQEICTPGT
jgi:hypothetical protein